MDVYNPVSFAGIFVLVAFAWLVSADKKNMNRRIIGRGIGLQILIALFIFVVTAGSKVFPAVNDIVVNILDCASAGAKFVFGSLAIPPGSTQYIENTGNSDLKFLYIVEPAWRREVKEVFDSETTPQ